MKAQFEMVMKNIEIDRKKISDHSTHLKKQDEGLF